MTNITISNATRSIELSKKFAAAAAKYGTEEYRMLQEVRRDYPGFKVVEVARKASKNARNAYKGLTYEYMETYILSHDDENQTKMTAYLDLRGETEEAEEAMAVSQSYMEIKEWFLVQFPDISKFHESRIQMVENIQKQREVNRIIQQKKAKEERRNALLKKTV